MRGADPKPKTPYTQNYNLTIERSITNDIVATVELRREQLPSPADQRGRQRSTGACCSGRSSQPFRPFNHSGGTAYVLTGAISITTPCRAKMEKRMSHGYNLLATYTWSHALDDANTPLGSSGDNGQQNYNLIPMSIDYSQSPFDTRQRLHLNALYELPFGKGRPYLNQNAVLDAIVGGWSANATFVAQTGNYFTVTRAVSIQCPAETARVQSRRVTRTRPAAPPRSAADRAHLLFE